MEERHGYVYVSGNNGGDYLRIVDLGDDEVYLEVGHCCVVFHRKVVPVAVLTALLAEKLDGVELPWSDDLNESLLSRMREPTKKDQDKIDVAYDRRYFRRPRIHNQVGPKQLALKVGDQVEVTLDDGSKTTDGVAGEPAKLCGTWTVWLGNPGPFALCRCKPLKVRPCKGAK